MIYPGTPVEAIATQLQGWGQSGAAGSAAVQLQS